MYIYRCTFILTEYGNIATNFFISSLDKETVIIYSMKLFKGYCEKYNIPDAKFIQEVGLSSQEEMDQYRLNMKNNVKTGNVVN